MTWDHQEFAAVFNELYPNVCRFLECMLGRSGNAQEVAQESFVRLYRKGRPNMPSKEARFWVYRVARNLALNELSRTQTRTRLVDKARGALDAMPKHPDQQYEESERNAVLIGLLESLPEHQRAVLILREQQEMSYAEIARVLNVSEGKIKIDIHRARMRLREKWNEIHEPRAAIK